MKKQLTQRKEQALRTKEKLYKKAIYLFSQKGYNAVTIDEICEKCDVSKGAFHTHYSSKHDIVIEQSKKTDRAQLAFFKTLPDEMSSTEKLRQFAVMIGDYVMKEKGFEVQRIIYAAELSHRSRPGYIIDERRPLYTCLKTIVEEGQLHGEFRSDLMPADVLRALVSAIRGSVYEWLITSGQENLPQMILVLVDILIEGMMSRETSPPLSPCPYGTSSQENS
jgi:AcrR family transcriptional regulator